MFHWYFLVQRGHFMDQYLLLCIVNATPSSKSITFDWPTAGQYLSNLAWSGPSCHQEFKPHLYSLRMWVPQRKKYLHSLWVCRPWSYFWKPDCSLIILLVCELSIILEAGKNNIFNSTSSTEEMTGLDNNFLCLVYMDVPLCPKEASPSPTLPYPESSSGLNAFLSHHLDSSEVSRWPFTLSALPTPPFPWNWRLRFPSSGDLDNASHAIFMLCMRLNFLRGALFMYSRGSSQEHYLTKWSRTVAPLYEELQAVFLLYL